MYTSVDFKRLCRSSGDGILPAKTSKCGAQLVHNDARRSCICINDLSAFNSTCETQFVAIGLCSNKLTRVYERKPFLDLNHYISFSNLLSIVPKQLK